MILVENVTKHYPIDESKEKHLQVLKGISLEIQKGEIVAIVGASGAGKSTLLHILGTLDRPTSGRVLYEEKDVFSMSDEKLAHFRNRHIGFVFQFHHLLPEFSVAENVAMPALIQGMSYMSARRKAVDLLAQVGVAERATSKPNKLSGGEQQRVAVARALMNSPRVVLADEPSGNLDTANAQQLHALIFSLSRSFEQTFLIVTHNENLARMADRTIKIVDGRIAENQISDKS